MWLQEACVKHKTIAVGFHLQQLAPGGPSSQNPPSQVALKNAYSYLKCRMNLKKKKKSLRTGLECRIFISGAKEDEFQTVRSFILAESQENKVMRVACHSSA